MGKIIRTSVVPEKTKSDKNEGSLRPELLDDFIGQQKIKNALNISIISAKKRDTSLDHCLFYGPPGLGKTTLAYILSNEMQSKIHYITGAAIEKPGDIASILSTVQQNDILFLDEIHRMDKTAEEILYSAMEDNFISITIGREEQMKQIKLDIPPFTLVGATTRAGMISKPLRDRFGLAFKMEYYSSSDLAEIALRTASIMQIQLDDEMASIIAGSSRGTPRIVNRYIARVRDYLLAMEYKASKSNVISALSSFGVDLNGLDETDKHILTILSGAERPIGLNTLSNIIGEDMQTVEEVYEPYLLMKGYIEKTPSGRIITEQGRSLIAS